MTRAQIIAFCQVETAASSSKKYDIVDKEFVQLGFYNIISSYLVHGLSSCHPQVLSCIQGSRSQHPLSGDWRRGDWCFVKDIESDFSLELLEEILDHFQFDCKFTQILGSPHVKSRRFLKQNWFFRRPRGEEIWLRGLFRRQDCFRFRKNSTKCWANVAIVFFHRLSRVALGSSEASKSTFFFDSFLGPFSMEMLSVYIEYGFLLGFTSCRPFLGAGNLRSQKCWVRHLPVVLCNQPMCQQVVKL